jgi:RNA polymerase sigma-B factor
MNRIPDFEQASKARPQSPPPRRRPPRHTRSDSPRTRSSGELRLVRFQRSRTAAERDALAREYAPLARSVAIRFLYTNEPLEDLLQVALLGLLKAIDRYDPSRGTAFSSFAIPTILGELRRHLRDYAWSMHVPRQLQELAYRLPKAADQLCGALGRAPSVGELAEHLDVEQALVLETLDVLEVRRPASLEEAVSRDEGAGCLAEHIGVEDAGYEAAEDAITFDCYLRRLPPLQREILRLRFREGLLQREIAERVGVSQMQVSRLIRQSLEQLRDS